MALTQRHIARYLTQPAILRDPKVRALLKEVCYEIEERDKSGQNIKGERNSQ